MTERGRTNALGILALAAPFLVFLTVYIPAAGHGFISDDFGWIVQSHVPTVSELPSLFEKQTGFYRPIVALTFAANYATFGNHPLGYGLTNVALALTCSILLSAVARALGLPFAAAMFAGALWLTNFHGINMAVLWISGRTALLLTAAALAAAWCIIRGRLLVAAAFLMLALFSKEEAITLGLTLGVWIYLLSDEPARRRRQLLAWFITCGLALTVYAILRSHSGAFGPRSAPYYYQFTFSPHALARNLIEYADRALTLPAAITLLAALLLRPKGVQPRTSTPRLLCGAAWIVGGYGITLFLPVRSSLYACFPSAGACIIAADICTTLWASATQRAWRLATLTTIPLVIVTGAIHHERTHRWVSLADFSTRILGELESLTRAAPEHSWIVVRDDRSSRVNLESSFGTFLEDAFTLRTGRRLQFWIEPPLRDAALAGLLPPCSTCAPLTLTLRDGSLIPNP